MRARAGAFVAALVVGFVAASGCGKPIDIKQAVQIVEPTGGWYDAGIKDGKNKLTPSVTFRVKKLIDDPIRPLSLNLAFKKITPNGDEDFDDFYVQTVTFGDGNESAPLTVRTETGYTADPPQTRAQMLQHKEFQDLRVVIFAKHSSSNWVELGRFDIPRKLLAR